VSVALTSSDAQTTALMMERRRGCRSRKHMDTVAATSRGGSRALHFSSKCSTTGLTTATHAARFRQEGLQLDEREQGRSAVNFVGDRILERRSWVMVRECDQPQRKGAGLAHNPSDP
jgi:hypothetical protein